METALARQADRAPEEHKPMRYVSFIHRDDVGYGVSFPDFPG